MTPNGMSQGQAGNQFQSRGGQGQGNGGVPIQGFPAPAASMWQANFDGGIHDGQSPDSWSTSSAQGQPAPTTLNVEDWFQFFGINGDASNLNLDVSLS